MNKVLVIGASGLIGSRLIHHLVESEFDVGALSRHIPHSVLPATVQKHAVDILDFDQLKQAARGYDVIINCSGQITNPINACARLNMQGVYNITEICKENDCYLLQLSSVAVYGQCNEEIFEESPINPDTAYGAMKYFAEFQITNQLDKYSILRPCNIYGPGQQKGIVNYLLTTYFKGDSHLYFNNDGSMRRSYLYVDDLCQAITQLCALRTTGIFNLSSTNQFTIKELIALTERTLNYRFVPQFEPSKPESNLGAINDNKLRNLIEIKDQTLVDYLHQHSQPSTTTA